MQTISSNIILFGICIAVFIAIFVILCLIDFYRPPVVRRYEITTDKFKNGESLNIVLAADLHSHIYGENQSKIIELIAAEKPDLIALAGDIADDKNPVWGAELFLRGIKDIAPVYYVTGNHEFRSGHIKGIKKLFKKYKVNILEHSYRKIMIRDTQLAIGGVDDPFITKYSNPKFDWEKKMQQAFVNLDKYDGYKILLSHRPERIKAYSKTPFDLVLSGHAHGGQVRVPFILNGLLAPNQGLFPKYAGGIYKHKNFIHIVSRGISYHFFRPRVINPPEVVVIKIVKGDMIKRG